VALHSEHCEFPLEIDTYRGMVEDAVFDRLGRPSFLMRLWRWWWGGLPFVWSSRELRRTNRLHAHSRHRKVGFGSWPRKKLSGCGGRLSGDSWQPASWSCRRNAGRDKLL